MSQTRSHTRDVEAPLIRSNSSRATNADQSNSNRSFFSSIFAFGAARLGYASISTAHEEEYDSQDDDGDDEDDGDLDYNRESHGHGIVAAEVEATGTIFSSCLNITNTILGSGMLAMPQALAKVGLGLGSVLVGLSGLASFFGLTLLSHCAARVGRQSSFFQVSKITYPAAAIYFDLAIAIKCFGVSISYLVIIGDLVPQIMKGIYPDAPAAAYIFNKEFWITVAIFLVAPFAFAKKLDSLRYTSGLALCAVIYLVTIVVFYFILPPDNMPQRPSPSDIVWVKLDGSFFTTIPIFVFAFTCHQNIFAVHNELIDNTIQRVGSVVKYSIGTAFGVYQTIGILGYLTFGNSVGGNIIQMYPSSGIITGGQFSLAILFLLSYPLQCHPARASLDKVISGGSPAPMSHFRYLTITSGLLVMSYILAISVKDLSTVLSLVGATGSTTICYILPGILYYKLRESTDLPDTKKWDRMKVSAVLLAIFGVFVMIISVTMQIVSLVNGQGAGAGGHRRRDIVDDYLWN